MLAASLAVAVLLLLVSVALVLAQRAQLAGALDDAITRQSVELVAQRRVGRFPPSSTDDDLGWQVQRADGTLVAASGLFTDVPPLPLPDAAVATTPRATATGVRDPFRLQSRVVQRDGTAEVLHVAGNLEDVDDAVAVLATSLAVAVPLTIAALAGMVWLLIGRTLRPVERMRAEVAAISGADLRRRVAEPAADDEVARLARTLNDMLDRLERSAAARRRFVADASHELRSPVTRLRTQLEVAGAADDWADLAASLHEDVVELGELVDALLLLTRADDRSRVRWRTTLDLDDVVRAEVDRTTRPPGVVIDVSGVSAARVSGDRQSLARVVRNLLDNAVRHAVGRVEVTLAQADQVVLTVADDGAGIPPDQAEAVFERFTRLDDARSRDAGGVGLGLAIVRAVVATHGGTVAVEPGRGPGAHVRVNLPNRQTGPAPARHPARGSGVR